MSIRLGAAITAFQEENQIAFCLNSLVGFDEVVVVDSASADRTATICTLMGARVVQYDEPVALDGGYEFITAKQRRAVRESTCDWVLIIDSDERFDGDVVELRNWLRNVEADINAAEVRRDNFYIDGFVYSERVARLVKPQKARLEVRFGHTFYSTLSGRIAGEVPGIALLHNPMPTQWTVPYKLARGAEAVARSMLKNKNAVKTIPPINTLEKINRVFRKLPFQPVLKFAYLMTLGGYWRHGKRGYSMALHYAIIDALVEFHMWAATRGGDDTLPAFEAYRHDVERKRLQTRG